eukprot:3679332-Amphidinium_carterae.1
MEPTEFKASVLMKQLRAIMKEQKGRPGQWGARNASRTKGRGKGGGRRSDTTNGWHCSSGNCTTLDSGRYVSPMGEPPLSHPPLG